MYQYSIKSIIKEYENTDGNQVSEFFPLIINDRLQTIFQTSKEPTPEDYQNAATIINNIVKTSFEAGHIQAILAFYPYVRTKIAHYSLREEAMASMLLDVVSDFLLDCRWPDYADNLNENEHSKYFETFEMQAEAFVKGFEMMMEMQLIAKPEVNNAEDLEDNNEDNVSISDKTYNEISGNLEYYAGLSLSKEEVDKLLNYSDIKPDIVKWGATDTVVRDNILESLFEFYLNEEFNGNEEQKSRLTKEIQERRKKG